MSENQGEAIHKVTGKCVDEVIKEAMRRKCADNLTGILINLKEDLNPLTISEQRSLIRDTSCRSL